MKIKQVCEQTGLTDRAIRYYIEEGLVFPAYTENYMGRKAYDFTEADAETLQHISTLRRFGFTVEEIRTLQQHPLQSQRVLSELRERKQAAANAEQETLALLDRLGRLTDYTVSGLVNALGDAAQRMSLPPEKYRPDAYDVSAMISKGIVYAAVMLAPLGFLIYWLCWFWKYHRYAAFGLGNAVCILLTLLPTAVLLIAWLKPWIRRRWRAWMLCLLYLPFSWSFAKGMLGDSVTTDIRYYRVWDYYIAETDVALNALFPEAVHSGWSTGGTSIYTDTDYFYRARARTIGGSSSYYGEMMHSDHEIYAEWLIPTEHLPEEIERVDALFQKYDGCDSWGWQVCRTRHGDFTCWFLFWEFPLTAEAGSDPFDPSNPVREYLLFAYNEQTGRVRYGAGRVLDADWPDFPYFRTLDWGTEGTDEE